MPPSGKLKSDDGAGLQSRASALKAFAMVLDGRSLSDALPSGLEGLEARDEGLARAIVMAACKGYHRNERILADFLAKRPTKKILIGLLHLGLTEILDLQTADHAAVNSYVEIAKRDRRLQPYKNLVNAVLRRTVREADALRQRPALDRLPDWMARGWQAHYGAEAENMARAMLTEPALDLHLTDPSLTDQLLAEREGFSPAAGFLRLASPAGVEALPGYREGTWWVQDFSAQIPALLFGDIKGRRVGDFCAAPGGKAMQLAAGGAEVIAYDLSEKRLERVRENLARTGLRTQVQARDLAANPPEERFDAILIDAPCSATGTLRRNPDVLIHRRLDDIASLSALQRRLIESAITCLKPGGTLIYSVCSLEPEEGEAQVEWALSAFPQLRLNPVTVDEMPLLQEAVTARGDVRILPHMMRGPTERLSGVDGFYAVRLRL